MTVLHFIGKGIPNQLPVTRYDCNQIVLAGPRRGKVYACFNNFLMIAFGYLSYSQLKDACAMYWFIYPCFTTLKGKYQYSSQVFPIL